MQKRNERKTKVFSQSLVTYLPTITIISGSGCRQSCTVVVGMYYMITLMYYIRNVLH